MISFFKQLLRFLTLLVLSFMLSLGLHHLLLLGLHHLLLLDLHLLLLGLHHLLLLDLRLLVLAFHLGLLGLHLSLVFSFNFREAKSQLAVHIEVSSVFIFQDLLVFHKIYDGVLQEIGLLELAVVRRAHAVVRQFVEWKHVTLLFLCRNEPIHRFCLLFVQVMF